VPPATQQPRLGTGITASRRQLAVAGSAAFFVYFAMYAFRKPVAAATFAQLPAIAGFGYKTALILAQTLGYAFSKMIGVRIVSAQGEAGRQRLILMLIGLSWLALVFFALLPPRWGPACLFLNGLPLGMIWGLVVGYLEGRRASELLMSMLTASFIISSGVTKTVGSLLVAYGVSPFWMPAATGLLFAPLLVVSLAILARTPPPDALDRAARRERRPMDRTARRVFVREHAFPLAMLVAGYLLLAALRDFRDNFAADMWAQLGRSGSPSLLSATEVPVTIVVIIGLATLGLIRNNLAALIATHGMVLVGACTLGLSAIAYHAGLVGPVVWMILTGIGIYLAYAPFNAVLFERMIAVSHSPGNAGFLIYLADSFGYGGSVALLLLLHARGEPHPDLTGFFLLCSLVTSGVLIVATLGSAVWFMRDRRRR
jgi:MFS family permease